MKHLCGFELYPSETVDCCSAMLVASSSEEPISMGMVRCPCCTAQNLSTTLIAEHMTSAATEPPYSWPISLEASGLTSPAHSTVPATGAPPPLQGRPASACACDQALCFPTRLPSTSFPGYYICSTGSTRKRNKEGKRKETE